MAVISIISTKGGVGKTTLTANLSGYLSSLGHSVLMIDADPQPSLSSYYGITKQANGGLVEILYSPKDINRCISKTTVCDLIYSNDNNNELQHWLLRQNDKLRLKTALSNLAKKYDFIFIDTQGAKGILQDSSILAADILLSPILPEIATIKEFYRGTLSVLSKLKPNNTLAPLFGVIYKLDRTIDAKQLINAVNTQDNLQKYSILKNSIPQSVVFKESATKQIPVVLFANGNKRQKAKATKSIQAIKDITQELNLIA